MSVIVLVCHTMLLGAFSFSVSELPTRLVHNVGILEVVTVLDSWGNGFRAVSNASGHKVTEILTCDRLDVY